MISLRMLLTCLWSVSILAVPIASQAEIALSFFPTEEAKFLFKGEGSEGVVSIHLTVDYDTSDLFAPEVTIMGGKLLQGASPDEPPGRLHVTLQTDEQTPDFEVTLFFQKKGDYPAVINFVSAEVTEPSGTQRPIAVEMLPNPNLPLQKPAVSVEPVEGAAKTDQGQQTDPIEELER